MLIILQKHETAFLVVFPLDLYRKGPVNVSVHEIHVYSVHKPAHTFTYVFHTPMVYANLEVAIIILIISVK
jgi:hypothetical protein